ncbi:MAG: trehalase family glycosidase [Clostridia bacterium]|nr:trehalase family glycosidase [Clostridia bacterium]
MPKDTEIPSQKTIPDTYGYGQIFAFSALDGKTSFRNDFVGTLTAKPVGIRFELKKPVTLYFDTEIQDCNMVTSDTIDIETIFGQLSLVYKNCHTVVGISPVIPKLQSKYRIKEYGNGTVCGNGKTKLVLRYSKTECGYRFALAYAKTAKAAKKEADSALESDFKDIKNKRLAFYLQQRLQKSDYDKLYLKCLSVLKGNIYSPEGKIPCRFTTPDRVPHKNMWLWDSVFHALALKEFCPEIAEEAIEAVMHCQKKNGMIPHMMTPYRVSRITQPPVLAWGVWKVYQKTKDKSFLERMAFKLSKYLLWDIKHRDHNQNGLPEWKMEHNKHCRCGECGMDNSPRFDNAKKMDAVDFSCFLANDCLYLSKIFSELKDGKNATVWKTCNAEISKKINSLLWNEQDGMYYDLYHTGEHNRTASCASFLPLFCGIADKEQAERLIENLKNKKKFNSPLPIPSLAMDDKQFSSDMWRGSVWLNYNYLIVQGLKKYGYHAYAEEIKTKTLSAVKKWYETCGVIYEFYDVFNEESPDKLLRKGVKQQYPDWRMHMHAICDFGWSAAITLLLILDK